MHLTTEEMKEATIEKLFGLYKPDESGDEENAEWKMIHQPSYNEEILDDDDSGDESD